MFSQIWIKIIPYCLPHKWKTIAHNVRILGQPNFNISWVFNKLILTIHVVHNKCLHTFSLNVFQVSCAAASSSSTSNNRRAIVQDVVSSTVSTPKETTSVNGVETCDWSQIPRECFRKRPHAAEDDMQILTEPTVKRSRSGNNSLPQTF